MMKSRLAPPRLCVRPFKAFSKILLAGPGAKLPRFVRSGLVADSPIRPTIETSAISAGNIDRIP